jgi:hypothetical protein
VDPSGATVGPQPISENESDSGSHSGSSSERLNDTVRRPARRTLSGQLCIDTHDGMAEGARSGLHRITLLSRSLAAALENFDVFTFFLQTASGCRPIVRAVGRSIEMDALRDGTGAHIEVENMLHIPHRDSELFADFPPLHDLLPVAPAVGEGGPGQNMPPVRRHLGAGDPDVRVMVQTDT